MMKPKSSSYLNRVRAAKWLRPALTVLLLVVFGLSYLVVGGVREETNQAVRVLASGDAVALKDYILSFGAWAPVVSAGLMVLQALLAFLPSFILAFANGLAFGVFWGGMLSLASAALAAAISFSIAHALGRTPVEAMIGKRSLGSADKWFVKYGAYAVFDRPPHTNSLFRRDLLRRRSHPDELFQVPPGHNRRHDPGHLCLFVPGRAGAAVYGRTVGSLRTPNCSRRGSRPWSDGLETENSAEKSHARTACGPSPR